MSITEIPPLLPIHQYSYPGGYLDHCKVLLLPSRSHERFERVSFPTHWCVSLPSADNRFFSPECFCLGLMWNWNLKVEDIDTLLLPDNKFGEEVTIKGTVGFDSVGVNTSRRKKMVGREKRRDE